MRSRAYFLAAVVLPLVAVIVLASTVGRTSTRSSSRPTPLPIDVGGAGATAALYPITPTEYRAGPALPSLDGTAPAYRVPAGTWTAGDQNGSVSSGTAVACSSDATDCPTVPPTTRPEGFPTEDDARATALAALRAAGFPVDGAAVRVDDVGSGLLVSVDPVVAGTPTDGFTATVQVGPNRAIEYGTAPTGTPERGDDYPMIGTHEAIARLNEGLGLIGPQPLLAREPTASGTETRVVTFTAVERVLAFAPTYTGEDGWLVPAYRLHADDGTTKTVLAIDDRYVAPPPADGTKTDGSGSSAPGSEPPSAPGVPVPLPAPETVPPATGATDTGS